MQTFRCILKNPDGEMWEILIFFSIMEGSSWIELLVPPTFKATLHPVMKHWLPNHKQQNRGTSLKIKEEKKKTS